MKNREKQEEVMTRCRAEKEMWRDSCLSIEELLCLLLLGYSSRQLFGEMEYDGSLKAVVSKSIYELDKAKRILDRQAKAGVVTIPYYAETYPRHFRNLGMDAPPLIHVLGEEKLLNREDNVAIIGARAADKEGLDMAYRLANQIGRQGHVVISGLALGCDTAAHRGCLERDCRKGWNHLVRTSFRCESQSYKIGGPLPFTSGTAPIGHRGVMPHHQRYDVCSAFRSGIQR